MRRSCRGGGGGGLACACDLVLGDAIFYYDAHVSRINLPSAVKIGPPRTPNPVTGPRIIRGPVAEGRGKRISNYATLIGAIP